MKSVESISIVIPAYKAENYISRAVLSCLSEGVRGGNIIVVEDGVFDETSNIVKKIGGVSLYTLPSNKGAQYARNFGLSHVRSEYVIFLDSDDYFEEGALLGLLSAIEKNNSDVAIGPWRNKSARKDGRINYPSKKESSEWISYWLNDGFYPPCAVMWRSHAVRSIGAWDESIKKNQDGEIMIRGFLSNLSVAVSCTGSAIYWQHKSPHRVSQSSLKYGIETGDKIYRQLVSRNDILCALPNGSLGKFCCKMAWYSHYISSSDQVSLWKSRAVEHGFLKKGYNLKSNVLASLFGVPLAAKIKAFLLPSLLDMLNR